MKAIATLIASMFAASVAFAQAPAAPAKKEEAKPAAAPAKKEEKKEVKKETKKDSKFAGAFVKEPVPGKYDWVVSFDATSLYPSIIMQYNLSPETMVVGYTKDVTVERLMKYDYNLDDLKEVDYCMAANGFTYKRDKQGLFPEIVQKLFDDRKSYKIGRAHV